MGKIQRHIRIPDSFLRKLARIWAMALAFSSAQNGSMIGRAGVSILRVLLRRKKNFLMSVRGLQIFPPLYFPVVSPWSVVRRKTL